MSFHVFLLFLQQKKQQYVNLIIKMKFMKSKFFILASLISVSSVWAGKTELKETSLQLQAVQKYL